MTDKLKMNEAFISITGNSSDFIQEEQYIKLIIIYETDSNKYF